MVTLLNRCFFLLQYSCLSTKSTQNTKCKAKKDVNGDGRRTKVITEYRQTGGDGNADGDNIVGMGW